MSGLKDTPTFFVDAHTFPNLVPPGVIAAPSWTRGPGPEGRQGQDVGVLVSPVEQSRCWWWCCWKEFARGQGGDEHTEGTAEAHRRDTKCKPVSFEPGDISTWLSQGGVLNTGSGQDEENKKSDLETSLPF